MIWCRRLLALMFCAEYVAVTRMYVTPGGLVLLAAFWFVRMVLALELFPVFHVFGVLFMPLMLYAFGARLFAALFIGRIRLLRDLGGNPVFGYPGLTKIIPHEAFVTLFLVPMSVLVALGYVVHHLALHPEMQPFLGMQVVPPPRTFEAWLHTPQFWTAVVHTTWSAIFLFLFNRQEYRIRYGLTGRRQRQSKDVPFFQHVRPHKHTGIVLPSVGALSRRIDDFVG